MHYIAAAHLSFWLLWRCFINTTSWPIVWFITAILCMTATVFLYCSLGFFFLIKKYVLTACLRGHVWRHQIGCVHLHVACNLVFATFDAFEQTLNSSSTVWAADMNDSSGCVTCWREVCCYFTKWSNYFHWWTIKWEKIHRLTLNRPQTNLANTQDHLRKLKTCCH